MTVEELDQLLAQPVAVLSLVAKATTNVYDDAVLAALLFVKDNPTFKGWLAQLLTPMFGCSPDDCDCPAELLEHAQAFEAIRASRTALGFGVAG